MYLFKFYNIFCRVLLLWRNCLLDYDLSADNKILKAAIQIRSDVSHLIDLAVPNWKYAETLLQKTYYCAQIECITQFKP